MFFRKVGITLALGTVCAFAAAAMTITPGATSDVGVYGKRQDRLVPAGGFQPAHSMQGSGYGVHFGSVPQAPADGVMRAVRS